MSNDFTDVTQPNFRRPPSEEAFPDRACETCTRRGGGNPTKGLENVRISYGRQLCGHCSEAFEDWYADKKVQALARWIADRLKDAQEGPQEARQTP